MLNIISDKKEYCKKFGIELNHLDWNCHHLPATLVTDKGSEYASENFEQLTDFGVSIVNLPAYRPELKGSVEKLFDVIQETYKPYLKGKLYLLQRCLMNICEIFKDGTLRYGYFLRTYTWMKRHRICILILYHIRQEAKEDSIQEFL